MTMTTTDGLIQLKDVCLDYESHHDRTNNLKEFIVNLITRRSYVKEKLTKIRAIDHMNFTVQEDDRIGIIGLNGSGKSTLLKVISGILVPSAGQIKVDGSIQPLIEVGAGFDAEFTGRENIYLNGYMLGFTKKQLKEKEKEIIDFTELGEFIDTPVKYYSSGMTVRLAFTIATSISPDILIIDEMLAAGDAAFISKAEKRIDHLINQARALVIVSHDLGFIERMCTRTYVMEKGKFIFGGKTEEALQFYKNMIKTRQQASINN
ncbi:MAG: ABC transporter ATP-binding protein [Bdellovibrionota bacterium]